MDELVMKYFEGELSHEACLALLREAGTDAALKDELYRVKNIIAMSGFTSRSGDHAWALGRYREFALKRKSAMRISLRTLRYAATVAVIVVGTWIVAQQYFTSKAGNEPLATVMQSIYVPAGQRISLTLDDNTVVWLNSRSKLSYPSVFSNNERRVELEGEAYFEVAKDAARPFCISSGDMEIAVIGTSFNVHNYSSEAAGSVSLLDGSLKIFMKGNEKEYVTLKSDEEAVIKDHTITVGYIQNPDYFLWTRGLYVFENESFGIILKKLKLYYDVNIEVRNTEMLQWRYNVKFRQRDGIREILGLMQTIYPFRITVNEESNTIIIN